MTKPTTDELIAALRETAETGRGLKDEFTQSAQRLEALERVAVAARAIAEWDYEKKTGGLPLGIANPMHQALRALDDAS